MTARALAAHPRPRHLDRRIAAGLEPWRTARHVDRATLRSTAANLSRALKASAMNPEDR